MTNGWPPRWLTAREGPTLGGQAAEFIEGCCKVTKESLGGRVGSPLLLRPWQRELLDALLVVDGDGTLVHRSGLIGLPRKNGKSSLGAALALWALLFGPEGGEVYSVAGDREQARLVFGMAKRMCDLDATLAAEVRCYRDVIEYPETGSTYRVLSAEVGLSEGLSPTFTVFDELHVQASRDHWDTMQLGAGARPESLLLGITTAGVMSDRTGRPTLAYGLYEHGKRVSTGEVEDPSFFMSWWEAPDGADWQDPATWEAANPGFDDLVAQRDFEAVIKRTPESEFRIKRCNQWVASSTAWLPAGAWEACSQPERSIPDGAEVVLGFDGSYSGDSTALVAVSIEEHPLAVVAGLWERALDDPPGWRVPAGEVLDTIRAACGRWKVRELAADPALWRDQLEDLAEEGVPVVEFPQSPGRMVPATQRVYEAVAEKRLAHDGDPALARHVANARTRVARGGGVQLVKAGFGHNSPSKIDLAVALVMAWERAAVAQPEARGQIAMSLAGRLRERGLTIDQARAEATAKHQARIARILKKGRDEE